MNRLIDSILIPTDNSEGARTGAKLAIALASRIDADLHVLSVVTAPSELDGVTDATEAMYASLEDEANDAVATVTELAQSHDADLEVTTTVTRGTPFQSIRAYATRREIDVIAMGTKGRDGLDSVLLGSVTENVLRTARTPVLAVPPNAETTDHTAITDIGFDEFLLPTDGSDGATIAATWGIELAKQLESTIHTVYSVETSPLSRVKTPEDLFDALEQRGEDAIEDVRTRAIDAGVSITAAITTGSPADVILRAANERDVDLIVMGTHGRTGIGQWFLGSVTENVVRATDVPVFCVPVSAEVT